MRNFVGSFGCIDKLKHALRRSFELQKQRFTLVFSVPGANILNKVKNKQTKRNFLIYNRFTGNHPRIFGNSNEGSYLHKKRDFSRQMAIFAVFYLGMLEDAPPESLEDPSAPPLPTSSRAENLILTPSTGTDLSPRLEFYRSFCSKIILHHKT